MVCELLHNNDTLVINKCCKKLIDPGRHRLEIDKRCTWLRVAKQSTSSLGLNIDTLDVEIHN